MPDLLWSPIAVVAVEANHAGVWKLVVDYVGGARLLRMRVVDHTANGARVLPAWIQAGDTEITADGSKTVGRTKDGLLLKSALRGALIGKIGGSTADLPDETNTAQPYGSRKVFAIGTYCVVTLAAADAGPLFMAMNDSTDSTSGHAGTLRVAVEEYLL